MAGQRVPAHPQDQPIDSGTLARHTSPRPGPVGTEVAGMADLESALALLKSEKYWHRSRAAELLGRMGKAAAPAIPALLAAMGDPQEEVRKAASVALGSISAEDALEH